MNCEPGESWLMYVKRSSFGPIVIFVTTEFKAAIEMMYGLVPPVTCKSRGWQVCRLSEVDTFDEISRSVEDDEGRQLESPSVRLKK